MFRAVFGYQLLVAKLIKNFDITKKIFSSEIYVYPES